jgi:NADH/F420H2 dehydrogenase subunit C
MINVVLQKVESQLRENFPDALIESSYFRGELTIIVKKNTLIEILSHLKTSPDLRFGMLTDLTATDWPGRSERHEIVYLLYSLDSHTYVRIKIRAKEREKVPTLTGLWDIANWLEREVYDMFGIEFQGHPDMTRILTPEGFDGYPLRKDFPLTYEVPQFSHNIEEPPEVIK